MTVDSPTGAAPSAPDPAEVLRALLEILEASPVAMLAEDRAGKVQLWNRSAERIFGWSATELLGQPLPTIPADLSGDAQALLVSALGGVPVNGHETRRLRKDGTLLDVTISCAPLRDRAGAVVGSLAVLRDISAHKAQEAEHTRREASLRRAETMQTMGALIAGVAHEVRNPLFGMTATLDAFGARFGDREEYQRYFGHLRGEMDRLARLMKDLLEYGKPAEADLKPTRIDGVIASAVDACAVTLGKARVRAEISCAPGLPAVNLDEHRIGQVVQNLIENAAQHSKPEACVRVEATVSSGAPRELLLRVLDEGTGFKSQDLPHVFEPFFTRRRGGTGLGLSIVQRIVEQHGGRIEASNRLGGGAAVTVALPVSQERS